MKTLTTIIFALCLSAVVANAAAVVVAEPNYEKMRPRIVEGEWPTNGVLTIAGPGRSMMLLPKQLCVDVGKANVTNTCTVTLYSAALNTYTFDTLAAQINGSEAPIELTNKSYSLGYGETLKFTSSATGTDITNMVYRLLMFEVPLAN